MRNRRKLDMKIYLLKSTGVRSLQKRGERNENATDRNFPVQFRVRRYPSRQAELSIAASSDLHFARLLQRSAGARFRACALRNKVRNL